MLKIRNEQEADYKEVEAVTRKAFYNMYVPGCMEHYLVHIMRGHEDFIPELDFVAELDGRVIGNIMYTKAKLTDESGNVKEILTFGSPANYVARGFVSCKKHNVCVEGGRYPAGMLVKELAPGALDGRRWYYSDSPVMNIKEEEAIKFDDSLEPMEKKWMPSQEEFYIISQAALD